jgi:ribonuclease HI
MKPDVTLIADASLSHNRTQSAWAAWMIADNRESCTYAAKFKVNIACVDTAELAALVNGLVVAHKRNYLKVGFTVLLQSDSTSALGLILHATNAVNNLSSRHRTIMVKPKEPTAFQRTVLKPLLELKLQYALNLQVRHVKGHTNKAAGRYSINRLVDRLAGEARRSPK